MLEIVFFVNFWIKGCVPFSANNSRSTQVSAHMNREKRDILSFFQRLAGFGYFRFNSSVQKIQKKEGFGLSPVKYSCKCCKGLFWKLLTGVFSQLKDRVINSDLFPWCEYGYNKMAVMCYFWKTNGKASELTHLVSIVW